MRACIYLARRGTSLVQFLCTAIDGVGDAVADEFELAIAHFVKYVLRLAALCAVGRSERELTPMQEPSSYVGRH